MNEDHFLHLTDVGREVAEIIYERHCFFTERLISLGVDPKTAEAMLIESNMLSVQKVLNTLKSLLKTTTGR